MNHEIIEVIITVIGTMAASSGFWLWVQKRMDKKSLSSKLLMGLAGYRIVALGLEYIQRGWVTKDEFELVHDLLYQPYKELGGNGMAAKVICKLENLPLKEEINIEKFKEC